MSSEHSCTATVEQSDAIHKALCSARKLVSEACVKHPHQEPTPRGYERVSGGEPKHPDWQGLLTAEAVRRLRDILDSVIRCDSIPTMAPSDFGEICYAPNIVPTELSLGSLLMAFSSTDHSSVLSDWVKKYTAPVMRPVAVNGNPRSLVRSSDTY